MADSGSQLKNGSSESNNQPKSPPKSRLDKGALAFAGFIFLGVFVSSIIAIIKWFFEEYNQIANSFFSRLLESIGSDNIFDIGVFKLLIVSLGIYLVPFSIALTSILSALLSYFILVKAFAIDENIVISEDRQFLSDIVNFEKLSNKYDPIDVFVKFKSLSGITGFFTKINITGLPLATILLTLIFCLLGVFSPDSEASRFFDFTNLTLGAFLGSYVQRTQDTEEIKFSKNQSEPETTERQNN